MKAVLLGPDGQLGFDIRRTHEASASSFDMLPIPRRQLDLSVPGAAEAALNDLRFDALVNCAGCHKTDEIEDDSALAFAVNARAVQDLARICARKRARLIHVSTDYVFGGDAARTEPLREDDRTAPVNVYGASKMLGETLIQLVCDNFVIVRVASLFGIAGASGKGGNFVETIVGKAGEGGTLRVVQDQVMSPTATSDVADVIVRMLTEGCATGIYHVVNSGAASWFDFARKIVRGAAMDADVVPCASHEYPTRAARPRYSALDSSKVSHLFGPMASWQEALERYLRSKGHAS